LIYSAMMFALGVCVSGLVWLALSVALVRRARRLTERRLLASLSTRRAEYETERDELRARHAVEIHQQRQQVSRVLDMATAYRLEADVKERDLASFRAELKAREEDYQDLEHTLSAQREIFQELERRHAEAGAGLRAAQHALKLESKRRAIAEEALNEATILGDQRRIELSALRAQNEALRTALGDRLPFEHADGVQRTALPAELPDLPSAPGPVQVSETAETAAPTQTASIVPLRPRPPATPEQSAMIVAEAARDLHRLAGEGHGELGEGAWRAPAHAAPDFPADIEQSAIVADLDAHRANAATASSAAEAPEDVEDKAERRFFRALSEIRALKRASGQAGE
jgi:hypothetical protein